MKKSKLLLPLICVGLIVSGCGSKTIPTLENGEQVVASIEGKDFTANDLYNELKSQGGTTVLVNLIDEFIANKEIKDDEEANKYAESQISTLKAQYESYGEDFDAALTSAGYKNLDEFKKVIALDYKKNTAAENYIKSTITDKEIEEYYENSVYGKMNVRYILIKPETTDDMTTEEKTEAENKALEKAKEVIAKLKDGKKFEDLAKEYSDDSTTAENGGLYEGFEKDEVVEEFWNASVALKDGKYTTTPVKSSYGYFVISRISQDEKPSLKDAKADILTELTSKKTSEDENASIKAWVELRKKYNLDIIDSDILSEYNKNIKEYK